MLTHYDEDHYKDIENLIKKIPIISILRPKNIDLEDLYKEKNCEKGDCTPTSILIDKIDEFNQYSVSCLIKYPEKLYVKSFYLQKEDLKDPSLNNLSMLLFITYNGVTICVPGDLEEEGWKTIIDKKAEVKGLLQQTKYFVASHHGRDNGYCDDIFEYCKPAVVIISDKCIEHDTQEYSSDKYGKIVKGDGINYGGQKRKVLTTRKDGDIKLTIS